MELNNCLYEGSSIIDELKNKYEVLKERIEKIEEKTVLGKRKREQSKDLDDDEPPKKKLLFQRVNEKGKKIEMDDNLTMIYLHSIADDTTILPGRENKIKTDILASGNLINGQIKIFPTCEMDKKLIEVSILEEMKTGDTISVTLKNHREKFEGSNYYVTKGAIVGILVYSKTEKINIETPKISRDIRDSNSFND